MTSTFVDTGAWIAVVNRSEGAHGRATDFLRSCLADGTRLLTTNYVVAEATARLRYDAGLRTAVAFRERLTDAVAGRWLRVTWIDPRLEQEGWELMKRYADLRLSLTDATSAVVARRAKVRQVFGFDADFRALGFDVRPSR
ncbi:MAG: PIN domain-containing protein [Acidobacteria bacterium]|nr:PIN domain-containing protein [Acidobacteriota bacterium]